MTPDVRRIISSERLCASVARDRRVWVWVFVRGWAALSGLLLSHLYNLHRCLGRAHAHVPAYTHTRWKSASGFLFVFMPRSLALGIHLYASLKKDLLFFVAPRSCFSNRSSRWLTVNDAMDYLDAVKLEFRDQPEIYDEFLAIMGRFKTKQMLPPDVIVEVARLFRGRNSLVLRFNRFLPEGYKIGIDDIERMEEEYQAKQQNTRPGMWSLVHPSQSCTPGGRDSCAGRRCVEVWVGLPAPLFIVVIS